MAMKRILIDHRNSVNIQFSSTYDKMLVDHMSIPMIEPLYGFTRNSIIVRKRITLAVEMVAPLLIAYHFMEFLVMDFSPLTMLS